MFRTALILFCAAVAAFVAFAQSPVAPSTPDPVGAPQGENWSGYNITDSFEAGYRWFTTAGDQTSIRATSTTAMESACSRVRFRCSAATLSSRPGVHTTAQ